MCLATAAAREAANGPLFVAEAERILGCEVKVLTGQEEAWYSALGIISSVWRPDGIVGDLGGGSLELVDVSGREIGEGITLPLGGLRLSDMAGGSLSKARSWRRCILSGADLLKNGAGPRILRGRRHLAQPWQASHGRDRLSAACHARI